MHSFILFQVKAKMQKVNLSCVSIAKVPDNCSNLRQEVSVLKLPNVP